MSSEKYSGSCICGSVKYEITGEFRALYHCHCTRCRKASGTGHASNVILAPDAAEWTEGEELLGRYKVPDAERFGTVFCRNCGSPLPRVALERNIAVIPAGSLDSSPDIEPTGRIFYGSKAVWSCDATELPAWDEYPQKT
jgi:hypothetical protein